MDEKIFKERTKKLALRVMQLTENLPHTRSADVIAKLKIVEKESDETIYWPELLLESKSLLQSEVSELIKETDEILAMTVSSIKTLRNRISNRKS